MFFDFLSKAPPDPVFGLFKDYNLDPKKDKQYLCIGIYQNEKGEYPNFPSVLKAIRFLEEHPRKANYLPFEGNHEYTSSLAKIVFGEYLYENLSTRVYQAQTLGGTGAIRIGMDFLFNQITKKACYFEPSWPNHLQILEKVGIEILASHYLKNEQQVDFNHLFDFLMKLPAKTVVLLQPSCHNPTGCDLSVAQWKSLSKIFADHQLIPFFDLAYQGLGDSIDADAYPVRLFAEDGHEMLVATTCSKTFGLYCQRVGALFIVAKDVNTKEIVASHVNRLIRTDYSNPPAFGADLVAQILKNETLKKQWMQDLAHIKDRLNQSRRDFTYLLNEKSNRSFDFLLNHKGMFSLMGLSSSQVERLRKEFGIYLSNNGRMNFASFSQKNLEYIVDAIVKVMK